MNIRVLRDGQRIFSEIMFEPGDEYLTDEELDKELADQARRFLRPHLEAIEKEAKGA